MVLGCALAGAGLVLVDSQLTKHATVASLGWPLAIAGAPSAAAAAKATCASPPMTTFAPSPRLNAASAATRRSKLAKNRAACRAVSSSSRLKLSCCTTPLSAS